MEEHGSQCRLCASPVQCHVSIPFRGSGMNPSNTTFLTSAWPLSNDSQPHNSNSDLRRFWPRPHEITHPHTALSARFRASRRSVPPLPPDIFFRPRLGPLRASIRLSCSSADFSSTRLDDSRKLLHPSLDPFNLHNSRVRRASGFLLTAFSNATPTPSFSLMHPSRRHVRKSTSVIQDFRDRFTQADLN